VLKDKLQPLVDYFALNNLAEHKSINAAIEWHEDSITADNQTFAYLAACIGIEALLGDEENMDSMSKRLSDRYAYMLGVSKIDRDLRRAQYMSILNVRGKVVHAKASRLGSGELGYLRQAQSILREVIFHELNLLKKSARPAG
jgi:hypothetical protein